jgi:hypothetical protein
MTEPRVSAQFILVFAPECWTSLTKFQKFVGPPYENLRELGRGASAADNHLAKYTVLARLANRLKDRLSEDDAELAETGFSSASRSKEFAALVESLFCELYSALDGTRHALHAAFKNVRGVQDKSTERMFKRASEKEYGPGFPLEISDALAAAYESWFPSLRKIRTEVTHGDIGSCHIDRETQKVCYMHMGLGSATRAFVIKDVIAELNQHWQSVSGLLESIYGTLFGSLLPVTRTQVCGFNLGKFYERQVAAAADLSRNSGVCMSRNWFEKEPGHECPLRHDCGAYRLPTAATLGPPKTDPAE